MCPSTRHFFKYSQARSALNYCTLPSAAGHTPSLAHLNEGIADILSILLSKEILAKVVVTGLKIQGVFHALRPEDLRRRHDFFVGVAGRSGVIFSKNRFLALTAYEKVPPLA